MAGMPRPQRIGECGTCHGQIRYYLQGESGQWAHLDRADWINQPHNPDPTPATLAAAGLT